MNLLIMVFVMGNIHAYSKDKSHGEHSCVLKSQNNYAERAISSLLKQETCTVLDRANPGDAAGVASRPAWMMMMMMMEWSRGGIPSSLHLVGLLD
jgi:hypothetical protein